MGGARGQLLPPTETRFPALLIHEKLRDRQGILRIRFVQILRYAQDDNEATRLSS